jgi:hypothetical protein
MFAASMNMVASSSNKYRLASTRISIFSSKVLFMENPLLQSFSRPADRQPNRFGGVLAGSTRIDLALRRFVSLKEWTSRLFLKEGEAESRQEYARQGEGL